MTEAEMVTLASVIEKETGSPEERALISGVFHNRLRSACGCSPTPLFCTAADKRAAR